MNICQRFFDQAKERPKKIALAVPSGNNQKYQYTQYTFEQLAAQTRSLIFHFQKMGIQEGTKTLVFVRPGKRFPIVTFALYAIGAIPVFIDPGMGRKNLLHAVKNVKPTALIAEPEVHFLKYIFRNSFSSINISISTKGSWWNRLSSIDELCSDNITEVRVNDYSSETLAAILFTSGGTGIPKGVEYSHGIFWNQVDLLQNLFGLTEDDVDLPGFPLFALFTLCMGMKVVVPDMNPSKPSKANPLNLVNHIRDQKVTFAAGSPAIWDKVAKYCHDHKIQLPSIKYMVMFGAPVRNEIHQMFSNVLTNGTTYTPYGATECLPISNISGKEVLSQTAEKTNQGEGTCVGRPCVENQVKIIPVTEDIIHSIAETSFLPANKIGEIIVTGPTVTISYFQNLDKTNEAKIYDENIIWHRMGDLGYLDDQGRLWFCGRKSHRVDISNQMLASIPCEAIFNQHPKVKRTALIGPQISGQATPAIVIELKNKTLTKQKFESELEQLAEKHPHTRDIHTFFYHRDFPVDCRHNIKIDRLKLRDLAEQGKLQ